VQNHCCQVADIFYQKAEMWMTEKIGFSTLFYLKGQKKIFNKKFTLFKFCFKHEDFFYEKSADLCPKLNELFGVIGRKLCFLRQKIQNWRGGGREYMSISGEIRESTAGKSANLLL
jgi:hypothetical protein